MSNAKRIFIIADFKDEKPWSICIDDKRIVKGLIRSGCDVQRFSYRNILLQSSPLPGKKMAKLFAQKKANEILIKQVRYYYPDVILFLSMELLGVELIKELRNAARGAIFVGKDGDPHPEKFPLRIETGKLMDMVCMHSGGKFLETYKNAGVKKCAFIPFSCDPDIQYRYKVEDRWKTDITFLGTQEHSRLERDEDRYNITKELSEMPNVKLYGCFGRPKTEGLDSFFAICGAKIGLSINIPNDVYLYHSDRFINIPACGTFMLAKTVPGYELMFKDCVHLRYFDTADEFFELVDWYLKHDSEREKIAAAGMERAHSEFNCKRIAKLMLDLIETGSYDAEWAEII